ncbi:hypothetical protein BX666DRAFT_1956534 [Dichotomocladium elegans]|nr:hypothetical protein BX666DRAFT_1956466 [Dichotomocladium elegans]KAI9315532.1 hypothetical protein BX666DRAFT_1956534 [Dichotomocladium elegans]
MRSLAFIFPDGYAASTDAYRQRLWHRHGLDTCSRRQSVCCCCLCHDSRLRRMLSVLQVRQCWDICLQRCQ